MNEKEKEKEKLIISVKKFVRHRERMMKEHGAKMTLGKMDSVTKLLETINFYKENNIRVLARAILRKQDHLKSILPGRSSKFHDSSIKKVDEILGKCNNLIGGGV
jgi:hypothetical protein